MSAAAHVTVEAHQLSLRLAQLALRSPPVHHQVVEVAPGIVCPCLEEVAEWLQVCQPVNETAPELDHLPPVEDELPVLNI
jgi:hypothetical protein